METVLPILFALGTAVAFAASTVLVRVGVKGSNPLTALVVTTGVNVVVLWTLSFVLYDIVIDLWAWRWFILAGIFAPVLGRLANYVGIQRIGVNLVSPISNTNPLITVVFAVVILGEHLPLGGYAGVLLAVGGAVVLSTVHGTEVMHIRRRDMLFPVLGAFIYGSVQILRELGTDLIAEPVVGAAVNLTTSFVLIVFGLAISGRLRSLVAPHQDLHVFGAAGVVSSLGLASLYAALSLGQVAVVAPILNASPLFVLLFTSLFVREDELFTPQIFVGTVGIVLGVVLLTLST